MEPRIPIDYDRLAEFCRRWGVAELSLFGSVLRADFDPEHSDVDVLVAFQPGREVGLIAFFQMEHELSQLFGRRVDLLTPGGLKPWVRQEILGSARVVYAAA